MCPPIDLHGDAARDVLHERRVMQDETFSDLGLSPIAIPMPKRQDLTIHACLRPHEYCAHIRTYVAVRALSAARASG